MGSGLTHRGVRCPMISTLRYPTFLKVRSQKWPRTWRSLGETEQGSIMEAGWNSTSYAGCEYVMFRTHSVVVIVIRLCLERLGVLQAEDHTSSVIKVFWRYGPCITTFASEGCKLLQIYRSHAETPVDVLARTCRVPRSLGAR